MDDMTTPAHQNLEALGKWEHFENLLDAPGHAFHFNQLCTAAIRSYEFANRIETLEAQLSDLREIVAAYEDLEMSASRPPGYLVIANKRLRDAHAAAAKRKQESELNDG